jgi:hypothetical protein
MDNQFTATGKLAIIIQQCRVLDFIDGKTQRLETPEEYVRQEIAKSLVREYGYNKAEHRSGVCCSRRLPEAARRCCDLPIRYATHTGQGIKDDFLRF